MAPRYTEAVVTDPNGPRIAKPVWPLRPKWPENGCMIKRIRDSGCHRLAPIGEPITQEAAEEPG